MNTPGFQIERSKGIGASELPIIFDQLKWKTQAQLVEEKKGNIPIKKENLQMRLGHVLEPILLLYACRVLGFDELSFDSQVFLQNGYVFAHLDYLSKDRSIVIECKTTSLRSDQDYGVDMTDDIPPHVQIQVQAQMFLSGASTAYVPVLFFKDGVREGFMSATQFMDKPQISEAINNLIYLEQCRFSLYRCDANDQVGESLMQGGNLWYNNHVIKGELVQPVTKEDCRFLYDNLNIDESIIANEEQLELIHSFNELTDKKKQLNKQLREIDKELEGIQVNLESNLGHNRSLVCPHGTLTRNLIKRKAFSVNESTYAVLKFKSSKKGRLK